MSVATNISQIKSQIKNGVTLIAVSKTKPLNLLEEALEVGELDFGENYVDEIVEKARLLPNARWHFIGHLESNKVKLLQKVPNLTIHSVDSVSLAEKIAKTLPGTPIFIQINISGEETKSGFNVSDLEQSINVLRSMELKIVGLMCIGEPGEGSRDFRRMVELRDRLLPDGKLSMGMSADWELAQQLGSDYVRIGSAIFGEREYHKSLQE